MSAWNAIRAFIAALTLTLLAGCDGDSASHDPQPVERRNRVERRKVKTALTNNVSRKTEGKLGVGRDLMKAIEIASTGDSKDDVLALDAMVRKSPDPDVRMAFLDAVSRFGKDAIGVISAYLADADEDVARTAMNHFESAVIEIDDEPIKIAAIEAVFETVSNAESLEFLGGQLNVADEKLSIETIVRIVESGNAAGAKVAKESYTAITGEEYVNAATARAWLRENYTPPEEM